MLDHRQQMNIPPVLVDDDGFPMSFVDILRDQGWTVKEFADAACVSRQCVYKYCNGCVDPDRIPYNVINDWCQILRIGDMQLYEAICNSFKEALK